MLEIRGGRIYFYNKLKTDLLSLDFQCISAYTCPACKRIIMAYYIGHIVPESLKEYMESDEMRYAYELGDVGGGEWISLQDHIHKKVCKWEIVSVLSRGVDNSVESFLQIHDLVVTKKSEMIQAITEEKMPGFILMKDEMGADSPILLYNENALLDTKGLEFDIMWELKKNLGKTIDAKLGGHDFEVIAPPKKGVTTGFLTFGTCTHCGKAPATRMPLKLCRACSDELAVLPPESQERKNWFKKGVT